MGDGGTVRALPVFEAMEKLYELSIRFMRVFVSMEGLHNAKPMAEISSM
jgi:hypothetical protein